MKTLIFFILCLFICCHFDKSSIKKNVNEDYFLAAWNTSTLNSMNDCCQSDEKIEKLKLVISDITNSYRNRNIDTIRSFLIHHIENEITISKIEIEEEFSSNYGWSYKFCIVNSGNPSCFSRYFPKREPPYRKFQLQQKQKWNTTTINNCCNMSIEEITTMLTPDNLVVRSWFEIKKDSIEIDVLTHLNDPLMYWE